MDNVFLLQIGKKSLYTGAEYPQFSYEVGESKDALIKLITSKYVFDKKELINGPDFPYFTDGGFKYTATNSDWQYTFTCFVKKLIK